MQESRFQEVVDSVYDYCKSEVIGPGFFRFKAEIDFNGVILVQNYLSRTGPDHLKNGLRGSIGAQPLSILLATPGLYAHSHFRFFYHPRD